MGGWFSVDENVHAQVRQSRNHPGGYQQEQVIAGRKQAAEDIGNDEGLKPGIKFQSYNERSMLCTLKPTP